MSINGSFKKTFFKKSVIFRISGCLKNPKKQLKVE